MRHVLIDFACVMWCVCIVSSVTVSRELYTVIHNYGNPYEKWNIFVAWPHLWLKLAWLSLRLCCVKRCWIYPRYVTLRYRKISGNVTSRHRASETMETPDFIPPTLWPQNSLDLNPIDYKVWLVMRRRSIRSGSRTLTNCMYVSWQLGTKWISALLIKQSDSGAHVPLRACINAKGGHFEHTLRQ